MTQQAREKAKKRLVELLKSCPDNYLFMVDGDFDLYESLADCLLENGVIVPPCKVGDTVYKIGYTPCTKYRDYPYSSLCEGCMTPCDSHRTIVTYVAPTNTWIVREFIDNAKQNYFLTREAAEQALKERD